MSTGNLQYILKYLLRIVYIIPKLPVHVLTAYELLKTLFRFGMQVVHGHASIQLIYSCLRFSFLEKISESLRSSVESDKDLNILVLSDCLFAKNTW